MSSIESTCMSMLVTSQNTSGKKVEVKRKIKIKVYKKKRVTEKRPDERCQ